jgi:hypothetical protein
VPDIECAHPCHIRTQTTIESVMMDTKQTAQAYLCLMMALRLLVTTKNRRVLKVF